MFGIETMFRLIFFAAKKGPCNNSLKTHLHPAASQIDSFYCGLFAHVSLSFELSQSKIASAHFSILMQNVAKGRNYIPDTRPPLLRAIPISAVND